MYYDSVECSVPYSLITKKTKVDYKFVYLFPIIEKAANFNYELQPH